MRAEVEALNERLRSINVQLRAQARAGTTYAPGLSYAPAGPAPAEPAPAAARPEQTAVATDQAAAPAGAATEQEPPFPPGGSAVPGGGAAAARLQKQYRKALNHLERVLEISSEMGDTTGESDACGTIADIYTEMGELEEAAHYYDKYIQMMSDDC